MDQLKNTIDVHQQLSSNEDKRPFGNKQLKTSSFVLKGTLLSILILFSCPCAFAQYGIGDFRDSLGTYRFKDWDTSFPLTQVLNSRTDLGLTSDDTLKVYSDMQDDSGARIHHYSYKQYYKTYEVEDARFIVHIDTVKAGVVLASGSLAENLDLDVTSPITDSAAFVAALNVIQANEYSWQNADHQETYRNDMEDSRAVLNRPQGKL
jgi:hypothetical protein